MKQLILLSLILAGCSAAGGDDRICTKAPGFMSTTSARERGRSCVHRWAYRLARAPGPNMEIAGAAMTACVDAIAEEARRTAGQPNSGTTAEAEYQRLYDHLNRQSLFLVIQARAGNCEPE